MANPANANRLMVLLDLLLSGSVVLVAILNWQAVMFSVFSLNFSMPVGAVLLIAFLMGALSGWAFIKSLDKAAVNEGKLLEWQAQDAKLAASVTSDREKQLEAKIATLETALKTALKKKS